jgi:hypothetical protein
MSKLSLGQYYYDNYKPKNMNDLLGNILEPFKIDFGDHMSMFNALNRFQILTYTKDSKKIICRLHDKKETITADGKKINIVTLFDCISTDGMIMHLEPDISDVKTKPFDINLETEYKNIKIHQNKIYTVKKSEDASPREPNCSKQDMICNVKYVYTGTSYPFPKESGYNPYNYYGNWYTFGIGENDMSTEKMFLDYGIIDIDRVDIETVPFESVSYVDTSYTLDKPAVLYRYKIKEDFNVLYMEDENSDYMMAFLSHFKIKLEKTSGDKGDKGDKGDIKYYDTYSKVVDGEIQKYNYTQHKNLLNKSGNPVGFDSAWRTVKIASSGDGDKPLAAKICEMTNDVYPHNAINGWVIKEIFHLMSCNFHKLSIDGAFYLTKEFISVLPLLTSAQKELENTNLAEYEKIVEEKKIKRDLYNQVVNKIIQYLLDDKIGVERKHTGIPGIWIPVANFERFVNKIRDIIPKTLAEVKDEFVRAHMKKELEELIAKFEKDKVELKDKHVAEYDSLAGDFDRIMGSVFRVSSGGKMNGGKMNGGKMNGGKMNDSESSYQKYLKYKNKYLKLKNQMNGY